MERQSENKKTILIRILIFVAFAYVLTYALELGLVLPAVDSSKTAGSVLYNFIAAAAMMMPAISVILTRIITKEGFRDHYLKPTCNKKTLKYYLLAWFLPAGLIFAGAAIYFLIFQEQFDWNISYYMGKISGTGADVTRDALRRSVISQTIAGVILGPININIFTSFGEEWGWRGYLLPKLRQLMPTTPAIFVSGLIWGLWYIPYVIAGLNYGMEYDGYPYLGILIMTVFCLVIGVLYSFVSIRANSCIPAIIAHGAVNASASAAVRFTVDGGDPLFGPSITGLCAMVPAIITAVILIVLLIRNKSCVKDSFCDTIVKASPDGE